MRLAELLPGWLLVIIKVRQVVKLISQIEKVFFQSVESLNELPALLVRKKRTNERQGVRNLVATWIVSCVCQLFVTVKFHMPTLELGLHICGKPVLAIRTHFGEEIFSETTGVLDRLGIGDLTFANHDFAAFRRRRYCFIHFVDGQQRGVHHQVDLAQHDEPCQEQQHFLIRPTVRPQGIPLFQHVMSCSTTCWLFIAQSCR